MEVREITGTIAKSILSEICCFITSVLSIAVDMNTGFSPGFIVERLFAAACGTSLIAAEVLAGLELPAFVEAEPMMSVSQTIEAAVSVPEATVVVVLLMAVTLAWPLSSQREIADRVGMAVEIERAAIDRHVRAGGNGVVLVDVQRGMIDREAVRAAAQIEGEKRDVAVSDRRRTVERHLRGGQNGGVVARRCLDHERIAAARAEQAAVETQAAERESDCRR